MRMQVSYAGCKPQHVLLAAEVSVQVAVASAEALPAPTPAALVAAAGQLMQQVEQLEASAGGGTGSAQGRARRADPAAIKKGAYTSCRALSACCIVQCYIWKALNALLR